MVTDNGADLPAEDGRREIVEPWRDPDSGCQYLIRDDTIIPRLSREGKPLCPSN